MHKGMISEQEFQRTLRNNKAAWAPPRLTAAATASIFSRILIYILMDWGLQKILKNILDNRRSVQK